jgi:hypothetical protein
MHHIVCILPLGRGRPCRRGLRPGCGGSCRAAAEDGQKLAESTTHLNDNDNFHSTANTVSVGSKKANSNQTILTSDSHTHTHVIPRRGTAEGFHEQHFDNLPTAHTESVGSRKLKHHSDSSLRVLGNAWESLRTRGRSPSRATAARGAGKT